MKFQDVANNPNELLAMTGYTLVEFNALIPWFEKNLAESKYTLEGKERKNQQCNYKNSPFPTSEDRLLFILVFATVHF